MAAIIAPTVKAMTLERYTFLPSDCVKISSSLNDRNVRPNEEPVSFLRKKNIRATKKSVKNRNAYLLAKFRNPALNKSYLVPDVVLCNVNLYSGSPAALFVRFPFPYLFVTFFCNSVTLNEKQKK